MIVEGWHQQNSRIGFLSTKTIFPAKISVYIITHQQECLCEVQKSSREGTWVSLYPHPLSSKGEVLCQQNFWAYNVSFRRIWEPMSETCLPQLCEMLPKRPISLLPAPYPPSLPKAAGVLHDWLGQGGDGAAVAQGFLQASEDKQTLLIPSGTSSGSPPMSLLVCLTYGSPNWHMAPQHFSHLTCPHPHTVAGSFCALPDDEWACADNTWALKESLPDSARVGESIQAWAFSSALGEVSRRLSACGLTLPGWEKAHSPPTSTPMRKQEVQSGPYP